MPLKPENIAKICHQSVRQYADLNGMKPVAYEWMLIPKDQQDELINSVWFLINNYDRGVFPPPLAFHEYWLRTKKEDGWTLGPETNYSKKTHPNLKSYQALSPDEQTKYALFIAIVRALYLGAK